MRADGDGPLCFSGCVSRGVLILDGASRKQPRLEQAGQLWCNAPGHDGHNQHRQDKNPGDQRPGSKHHPEPQQIHRCEYPPAKWQSPLSRFCGDSGTQRHRRYHPSLARPRSQYFERLVRNSLGQTRFQGGIDMIVTHCHDGTGWSWVMLLGAEACAECAKHGNGAVNGWAPGLSQANPKSGVALP